MTASANTEPAPRDRAEGRRRRRTSWRRWRRSRPFWGGLLLILAGAELLFIPLEDVFMRGAIGIVMHMGIGGISGFLIGAMLAACGVLLWFEPEHKTFYAVAGVVGGVASFPATNFGGFFLGLLLAITGGSLAFAWTPLPGAPAGGRGARPSPPAQPSKPDSGIDDVMDAILNAPWSGFRTAAAPAADDTLPGGTGADGAPRETGSEAPDAAGAGPGPERATPASPPAGPAKKSHRREAGPGRSGRRDGPGFLAGLVMAAIAASPLLAAGRAGASASPSPQPGGGCVLTVLCSPGPSPSPGQPGPPVVPTPKVSLPAGHVPIPASSEKGNNNRKSPRAAGTSGLEAYTAPVVLAAGTARVTHFAYQGVADLPVASGGTVQMMKFTASSFTGSGVNGDISQDGTATVITSPSLAFDGGISLYAAKLSGRLLGVPVTLTPHNAESVLLHQLKSVTPRMPVTMTDVTADQPIMIADSLQGRLAMSAG